MTVSEKTRENRVREMARRQGFELWKSRRRDPLALEYGRYQVVTRPGLAVVLGDGYTATLDEVEHWLERDRVRVTTA